MYFIRKFWSCFWNQHVREIWEAWLKNYTKTFFVEIVHVVRESATCHQQSGDTWHHDIWTLFNMWLDQYISLLLQMSPPPFFSHPYPSLSVSFPTAGLSCTATVAALCLLATLHVATTCHLLPRRTTNDWTTVTVDENYNVRISL